MRLNNKGFAISTIMYMVFVLAVLVMAITLTILNSRKLILDKQRNIALTNIYENNTSTHRTNCTVLASFGGTFVEANDSDTHKGIVYMNPIDISATCNAAIASANLNSNGTPTGINTGCMKFYIYDDTGDTYKMILDHNTSGDVAWNSGGSNSSMNEVAIRLSEDTEGWVGNPRLITANEVAHIVGADYADSIQWNQSKTYKSSATITDILTQNSWIYFDGNGNEYSGWQTQTANSTNKSKYAWLFDNIYGCGSYGCYKSDNNSYSYPQKDSLTTSTITGYWTQDLVTGYTNKAWYVFRAGRLYSTTNVNADDILGVRPVITIEKELINN